jgi:hypothetical protein
MIISDILFNRKIAHILTGTGMLFFCEYLTVYAQQLPPGPIAVYANPGQGLMFGAFYEGISGGTVIIYPNGSRAVTGSVVQANLGFTFAPAGFSITANPGTLVTILNGPDVTLTGSNGGSLSLHIGTSSTGSPFITTAIPPAQTQVLIGGTLTVGSPLANPAGAYNGVFSVTFIQQ